MDYDNAKKLIDQGQQLYHEYLQKNVYPFKEHSLEYFMIPPQKINISMYSVCSYHQYVLSQMSFMLQELKDYNQLKDTTQRVYQRFERIYQSIQKCDTDDFIHYFATTLKTIMQGYCDYVNYFQSYIEKKNYRIIKIIHILNQFLSHIGIYSLTCQEGDLWDDIAYLPEVNVSDNITHDMTKVDCVHRVYLYAYAIFPSSFDTPYVIHNGVVSLWKLEGE